MNDGATCQVAQDSFNQIVTNKSDTDYLLAQIKDQGEFIQFAASPCLDVTTDGKPTKAIYLYAILKK
jgi:hypothetical protein